MISYDNILWVAGIIRVIINTILIIFIRIFVQSNDNMIYLSILSIYICDPIDTLIIHILREDSILKINGHYYLRTLTSDIEYQRMDKIADMTMYTIVLLLIVRGSGPIQTLYYIFYTLRMIGVSLFLYTNSKIWLLVTPNFLESLMFAYFGYPVLIIAMIYKITEEFLHHTVAFQNKYIFIW